MCSLYSLPPISIKLELYLGARRGGNRSKRRSPRRRLLVRGTFRRMRCSRLGAHESLPSSLSRSRCWRLACLHSIFSGPEVNRLRLPQLPRRDLSTFSLIPRDWPRHDATAVRDANWNLSARVLACAGPQRIALTRVNTASQSTRTA